MTSLKIKHANEIMQKMAEDLGMFQEKDTSIPENLEKFLENLSNVNNIEDVQDLWSEYENELNSEGTKDAAWNDLQKHVKEKGLAGTASNANRSFEKLAKLSNALDSQGFSKLADVVDATLAKLIKKNK